MIKLSEKKLYTRILEEFKVDHKDVELSLKINIETNEFKISSISICSTTHMINVFCYDWSTEIFLIERTGYEIEGEKIKVKMEANADVEEIIKNIKANIK